MSEPRTVLIIDDSPTFRTMVGFALRKIANFERELQAEDGLEAIDALAKNHVDLIICDVNMPNMNGLELLKTIKGDEKLKSIPVIMLTTEGKDDDKERAVKLGANGYLKKPFKPNDLKAEVDKWAPK
ncbi:MAG: response regulator [Nitrospinae bacterium]|nr:response regulator [Nitrospinota bacterium]